VVVMRDAKRWSRADGQDPIFQVDQYGARRPDQLIFDLHRASFLWRRGAVCYGGSLSFSVYEFRGFRRNVLFNNCTINRFGLGKLPSQAF
jgi:hypothetical protein